MKKIALVGVFLALCVFTLMGAGQKEAITTPTGESVDLSMIEPVEIKLTSITPIGHPIYAGMELFKNLVELNTQGKITVVLFPASQLGDQVQQFDMVRNGSVEVGHIGGAVLSGLVKDYNICGVMYLYRDYDHFLKVWGGPIGKRLALRMEDHNIHVLNSVGLVGVRHVLSKKPVRSIDDLKGLSIRTPEAPMLTEGFRALGASPTTIAFAEVYTALQLGTVDAMECPLDWIYKMRFHEVAKNLTLTGHTSGDPYLYVVNKKWWDGLPGAAQQVIEEAALSASLHANMQIKLEESQIRKKMEEEEGAVFIEVDAAPFQERIRTAIPKLANLWGGDIGLYDEVKNTR